MKKPGIYAPLSAHYFDDTAIMEAGEDAELLYVRMLAYASRQMENEGYIPDRVIISRLGILPRESGNGTGNVPGTDAPSRAARLAEVGLLTRSGRGYLISSWLKWNRSAEEMGKERARDRDRKTTDKDVHQSEPGTDPGSLTGTDAGTGTGIPAPNTIQTNTDELSPSTDADASSDADDRFEEFWDVYGKKVDKKLTANRWRIATKKRGVTADLLIEQATRYIDHQKATGKYPQYTKGPAVWLNGECWNDELETASPTVSHAYSDIIDASGAWIKQEPEDIHGYERFPDPYGDEEAS